MTHDGRTAAWMQSWMRILAADEFKRTSMENKTWDGVGPAPEAYWTIIAEAGVLATLATAPDAAGFGAGEILKENFDAEREREAATRQDFEDVMKKRAEREDPSCTCEVDQSQCPLHWEDEAEDDDAEENST